VTKLQKGDFFASKLIVFSVTFGRKTKKSQPPTEAARGSFFSFAPAKESRGAAEESLFDLSRKPSGFSPAHLLNLFFLALGNHR
jgi:hypothetical protein